MTTTIGDVAFFQKGFAFKSKDYQKTGHRIIRVSNLNKNHFDDNDCLHIDVDKAKSYSQYSLQTNDAVISTVGSWPSNPESVVGKVCIIPECINGCLLNQNAVRLRATNGCSQDYLNYVLQSEDFKTYIIATAQGSASQASIKLQDIRNYAFDMPPKEYQTKVAGILGRIDRLIHINYMKNHILHNLTQELFWKLVHSLSNNNEYSLGSNSLCEIIKPGIHQYNGKKIYIATADVAGTKITNKKTLLTYEQRPSRANMQPIPWSLWFAKMKDSPKLIFINDQCKEMLDNCIFSTGFCGIKAKRSLFYYLWAFISSEEFEKRKNIYSSGTTMQAINNDGLKNILIVIPDDDLLESFADTVEPLFNMIHTNAIQNEQLSDLRNQLLPIFLSGALDLSNLC